MIGRVPFKLPDDGFYEIGGLAYLDEGFLVLDLERKFLGLGEGDRTVIKVAPTALHDVRLDRGLVRDTLRIVPKRLDLLDAVPGKHPREVELRIARKQRPWAEDLIDELRDWIDDADDDERDDDERDDDERDDDERDDDERDDDEWDDD